MDGRDLRDERLYGLARADELAWRRARALGISRRRFLHLLAAGSLTAVLGGALPRAVVRTIAAPTPVPAVTKPTPPEWFYDFGRAKEMRWEAMAGRGYVVPNDGFFVVSGSRPDLVDPATYRLRVEGTGVSRPREFTYDELLSMPSVSVTRFVECAGNGRSFFLAAYGRPPVGFKLGVVGVAEWTGVALREVLDRAGLKRSARDVMPEGLDDAKTRRPMPIAKALADDTLLAYEMNGQTLPHDHGFPIRALVPGWIGIANVKWVGRIEVSEDPIYTRTNTEAYVLVGPGYTPSPPARGPVLTLQNVKSAFELPWEATLPTGRHMLRGRSWSGYGRIAKVEISLDREITWQPARLREPNIPQAWVRWELPWEARPGTYSLRARATDERGQTQPAGVPLNEQFYLYNAVIGHPVTVA